MNSLFKSRDPRAADARRPRFLESAGIHDIAYRAGWIDSREAECTLPLSEKDCWYLDAPPKVGETHTVRVTAPFDAELGGTCTLLFEPSMIYLYGCEQETPAEEFERISVALCRFSEFLQADGDSALIRVEVLHVLPIDQLYRAIPEALTDYPFLEAFGKGSGQRIFTTYRDRHWLCRLWRAEGDLGQHQWIYTDEGGKMHEIVFGDWCFQETRYHLGNRVNG